MGDFAEGFEIGDVVYVKSLNKFGAFNDKSHKPYVIVELEDRDDCGGKWPDGILFTTPDDLVKWSE